MQCKEGEEEEGREGKGEGKRQDKTRRGRKEKN